jgi:predicted ribosomally synthesized peptide with SipW-like signal peptide
MKTKWVIAAVVALLGVLAYGVTGTGAWFTDSAKIENNSIATGNLDLTVWGGPFQAANLEPGADYSKLGVFCARNDGSYDMKWRGYLKDVSGSSALKDKLSFRATLNPEGAVGNYGPSGKVLFTDVAFSTLMNPDNGYILMDDPDYAFAPGSWACYQIDVRLAASAGNAVQSKTVSAAIRLDATQRINPGWSE